MPTASCPSVRFFRGPIPPPTVCESEVQMSALVVWTIASFGPGRGTGLSMNPTDPISFMTKAFIGLPPCHDAAHERQYPSWRCV